MKSNSKPQLKEYQNFREYLKDYYLFKKQNEPNFSYAQFSQKAGIKSANYLKLVIDGKRNLSDEMTQKFCKGLGLKGTEKSAFCELVQYCQTENASGRQVQFQKIFERHEESKTGVPLWLFWLFDEVFENKNIDTTSKESCFKDLIKEGVDIKVCENAFDIWKNENSKYRNRPKGEFSPLYWSKMKGESIGHLRTLIRKLRLELMYLGVESLYTDPTEEKEFGGFTFALTNDEVEELKKDLNQLAQKALTKNGDSKLNQKVYQVNFHLFPVSKELV